MNVCVLGKELGLLFYASPASVSLSVTFLKLFSHTCIVCSPHFIPSLYFIHCPEATFDTLFVFYTQSAVKVYTDHAKYQARICLLHLRKRTKFVGTIILSPNNNYSLKMLSATIKTENEEMIVAMNAIYAIAYKRSLKKKFRAFFRLLYTIA